MITGIPSSTNPYQFGIYTPDAREVTPWVESDWLATASEINGVDVQRGQFIVLSEYTVAYLKNRSITPDAAFLQRWMIATIENGVFVKDNRWGENFQGPR